MSSLSPAGAWVLCTGIVCLTILVIYFSSRFWG